MVAVMMDSIALERKAQAPDREDGPGLVSQYSPLVKRIAHHLISRLPPSVQVDDLVQAGMIGLLEASRNYDATQGASFETYAGIRIRGAMLDEIRKGDWAPRSLHRRTRALAKAVHDIEAEHGRDARDAEVAERMGISLDEYFQILQDTSAHKVFSFEDVPTRVDAVSEGFTQKIPAPHEYAASRDFQEALAKAIASLPERERLVIALYYDDELNLREVGEVLGVSESRVCQIHSQAMIRLRARMAEWTVDD